MLEDVQNKVHRHADGREEKYYDCGYHKCLVVVEERRKNLLYGNVGAFLVAFLWQIYYRYDCEESVKPRRYEGENHEALPVVLRTDSATKLPDAHHCEGCRKSGANSRHDSGEERQIFPCAPRLCDCWDDRPVRDVAYRVGDSAKEVCDCDVDFDSCLVQLVWDCEHCGDYKRVQDRSRKNPWLVATVLSLCLCDYGRHNRVVECVEYAGDHQKYCNKGRAHIQDRIVIVERVRRNKNVGKIFTESAQRVAKNFFFL